MRTDDGHIIFQCLNGDPEAFGILVDKYKEGIYAYTYAKLQNWHDAEDLSQEVFIQAYQKLHTLKRWDSFAGWLYRIASNFCKNWQISRSKRPDRDFIEDQDPAILDKPSIDSHHENEMLQSVREMLNSLPETYREVLMLYYFGGMDSNNIAEVLGTSPSAIRVRLSRAKAQLREDIFTMTSATFPEQKIKAGFTFRIVEAIKRIKIHPVSQIRGLPYGLSLATAIMVTIISLNPYINWFNQISNNVNLLLPSETKVLKVGEIPVDVVKISNVSIMANLMGKGKGGESKQPDENAFFMAPQAEGTWANKAEMLTARYYLSTCMVNGKIYAIGGRTGAQLAGPVLASTEEYDQVADKWTKKADMPTARDSVSIAVVNNKIYVIGGSPDAGFLATVEEYDPIADKWTKKTDMPTARTGSSASAVNGKIYVIGGMNSTICLPTVEEYDPVADIWSKKTDMPSSRGCHSASVVNGKIYVIGGGATGWIPVSTVEEYDPATDKWTKKANMPTTRYALSTSAVNGKIYAIGGGANRFADVFSAVEEYDPVANIWTRKADMPFVRTGLSTSAMNGKIYIIGGAGSNWIDIFSTVEEYTPEGWPFAVSSSRKLPTTWGKVRTTLSR
jgi:RNA polymerase sigma factor (sigma-70 family)